MIGAAFAIWFVIFFQFRAAHSRPNVPEQGAIILAATSPRAGAYAPAWGQEVPTECLLNARI